MTRNHHATRQLLEELRQIHQDAVTERSPVVVVSTIDLEWLLDLADAAAISQDSSNKGALCLDKAAGTSGRFDYLDELEEAEATKIDMQQHPEYWQQLLASVFSNDDEDPAGAATNDTTPSGAPCLITMTR